MIGRIFVVLIASACSSAPTPLPVVDPGNGTLCEQACRKRAALGCLEEALASACIPACESGTKTGFYSPNCVINATTREGLGRCRVRCGEDE